MENFRYKEYSPEENKIYNLALPLILEGVKNGLSFNDACDRVEVENKELKEFIVDDALKIIIAELHYVQRFSLQEVADLLEISTAIVNKANEEMIEDIENSEIEIYKLRNPNDQIGNA